MPTPLVHGHTTISYNLNNIQIICCVRVTAQNMIKK